MAYSPAPTPARAAVKFEEGFERNLARLYESSRDAASFRHPDQSPNESRREWGSNPEHPHAPSRIFSSRQAGAGYEALPLIEWLALALGSTAGLDAPPTALVAMPDGMPPALLVERFDIRRGLNDTRMLALEDLCSVLDLPSSAKYDSTMERIARAVRPISTAPEEDLAHHSPTRRVRLADRGRRHASEELGASEDRRTRR